MEIIYFSQYGRELEQYDETLNDKFYIEKYSTDHDTKYGYTGDSILYDLDSQLVLLYDKLRDIYFPNTDAYYQQIYSIPGFVQDAGQNSDCALNTTLFNELIETSHKIFGDDIYKHLYLVDSQYLIGTIQNHLTEMNDCFMRYYVDLALCPILPYNEKEDTVLFQISSHSRLLAALVETYFIRAYSIMDILTKIIYEIQNPLSVLDKYKKLVSSEKLWGDRKKFSFNNAVNTLFEDCELVKIIESLRNEIIHNGTWELNPKVFIVYKNNAVIEKYMLFPDFEQSRLACVKNRKHFFSQNQKINELFPKLHFEFMNRLLKTIELIQSL